MKIEEIRIYAEVLEQGLDFKEYVQELGYDYSIKNIYTKKEREGFNDSDSLIDRIRKVKDVDVLLTIVTENVELPLLMVEYSTAVPTDDHKMQRSDVYYWGSIFKTPMMKISPESKGMNQEFGGGSKITDDFERALAYKSGAVFFPIPWKTDDSNDVLSTKESALSCVCFSELLLRTLNELLVQFKESQNFNEYYKNVQSDYYKRYKNILDDEKYDDGNLKKVIVDSTRFHWYQNQLCAKINRFGHAMDPDRGVLYFVNMLVGFENTITEIQVNRSELTARGGYKSLFHALARQKELFSYVKNIYESHSNVFTVENAIYVFTKALNIENDLILTKVNDKEFIIKDEDLEKFLFKHPSMTSKSIFYLSSKLLLSDKNRDVICSITWNREPVEAYLQSVISTSYIPIKIKPLTFKEAKEDIITYASVELYKMMNCKLLAVSYPGAQGDRCILSGQGRKVLRTYVDIIAYKINNDQVTVYLEECKDSFSKSKDDVEKLIEIKVSSEKFDGLCLLAKRTDNIEKINNLYISVGAKAARTIPRFDVDYIFMFDLEFDDVHTTINYSIAVINTDLVNDFIALAEDKKHLTGKIILDKIYLVE